MIYDLEGNDFGIYRNDNHILKEWRENGRVVFSFSRRGDALVCHFSCEKKAIRHLRLAFKDFINWVFVEFPWCQMLMTGIDKASVKNLVKNFDFFKVGIDDEGKDIFVRLKDGRN